jgi:hypothetical protein
MAMLLLSVLSYLIQLVVVVLEVVWYQSEKNNTNAYRSFITLVSVYYALTELIHLIFAVKYWVLSRRVSTLFNN